MSPLKREVLDIDGTGLRHPQAEESQETGKRMVHRASGCSLGHKGTELHAVESQGGRVGVDLGAPDVLGRRVLDEAVENANPVEASHRRQPPSDGGPGQSLLLHGTGPQFDVAPLDGEGLDVDRGEELAQVAYVAPAGRP